MKKLFVVILISFMVMSGVNAANVGDIAGDVYPTDIKTFFFDHQLNSYNIGGETVIICEDLGWYYSFYVEWKGDERRLEMTDQYKQFRGYIENPETETQRNISLQIANRPKDYFDAPAPEHIYYTDIVTTLDGREIRSYNVNGRTAIVVEDLKDYGYDVIWDAEERTLNVYEKIENTPIETDIGRGFIEGEARGNKNNWEYLVYGPQVTTKLVTADAEMEINTLPSDYYYERMYPLKETFDFLNIKYSFENNVLTIDTSELKKFTVESTDKTHNDRGNSKIMLLHVEKTVCDGVEGRITYSFIGGHWQNQHLGKADAPPYVLNGKVYINEGYLFEITGMK